MEMHCIITLALVPLLSARPPHPIPRINVRVDSRADGTTRNPRFVLEEHMKHRDRTFILYCTDKKSSECRWLRKRIDLSLAFLARRRREELADFEVSDNTDQAWETYGIASYPALVHFAAGVPTQFITRYPTNPHRRELLQWLVSQLDLEAARFSSCQDLEKTMAAGGPEARYLVMFYNRKPSCDPHEREWDNVAKSLLAQPQQYPNLSVAAVPIDGYAEIMLVDRLGLSESFYTAECRFALLMQNNSFRVYDGILADYKRVRRFANTTLHDQPRVWSTMAPFLSEIQYLYMRLENDAAQRFMTDPKYVMFGFFGGCGAVILAVSIFWGLAEAASQPRQKKGI